MERVITVTVRDKIAKAQKHAYYVCGNTDYFIKFDFDDDWAAYNTKTARFKHNGTHQDVIFDGSECRVPKITDTYSFEVGVFAGDLRTTTAVYVPCKRSILCGSGSPSAPSLDVYAQIMDKLNGIEGGNVTPEAIAQAVDAYMKEHAEDDVIELIETITLDEDMAIERSEEPDGTPYSFKRIVLMFETTAILVSGNSYAYSDREPTCLGYIPKNESESTKPLYAINDFCQDAGRWLSCYAGGWTTNGTGVYAGNHNRRRWLEKPVSEYPTLTRVVLPNLPAGTKVGIWGVRA